MRTDRSLYRIFLRNSTHFLRRIIVPVEGQGGVTLSSVCPHCHRFPLEDHIWWFSSGHGKKRCSLWCAACVGQYNWKAPNRALVTQDSTNQRDAKVFRALAATRKRLCHNWINALTLLGKTSSKTPTAQSRWSHKACKKEAWLRIMDGLRQFVMVDNHEAVKVCEPDKQVKSTKVVNPEVHD